ncbi:biotin--[acetyl-CoA-carboxylase] ligase [Bifidobacterium santillanense]|uniref:biotin--[acetyl-CoA-carboxylase] ligase n=1 Tax=Bifidobacterium santillanense TaxID=2809028 RepID=UPI001F0A1C4D|nr:biotin--acetyl-CoA-carboxylase ligase [Bifidobacterium santillanense]
MTLPNDTIPDLTAAATAAATRMPATNRAADAAFLLGEIDSTNTLARELLVDGRLGAVLSGVSGDELSARGSSVSGPSTSSRAARSAVPVAVVAADAQTAGRGRLDHTWTSRPGESFTVTFVVAVPRAVATDESVNGWLQMIAGLSVLDALDDALAISGARPVRGAFDALGAPDGQKAAVDSRVHSAADGSADSTAADPHGRSVAAPAVPQLKWPNDVYLGGRKLGGILAEMVPLSAPAAAAVPAGGPNDSTVRADSAVAIVFGIGLNLNVPADRLPTAESTSLQLHYAPLPAPDALRDAIAAGVVRSLRRRLAAFVADPKRRAALLLRETRERSWTLGRRAVAHFVDGAELEGVAEDLNPDASLVLRDRDGVEHTVRTADVGVLPERDV